MRRWWRRKQPSHRMRREQQGSEPREEGVKRDEECAGGATSLSAQALAATPSPLPAIATIDRGTDIRPFLAAGVPEEMTRAALRRAWLADPGIRDFIGLSENFWDATTGSAAPGFGSLTIDEARQLLARLMGTSEARDGTEQAPPPTLAKPRAEDG